MKNWQEKLWSAIEYAPPILTLLFGSYVALEKDRNPPSTEKMLGWVLLILILIATTQLVDRARSLRLIRTGIDNLPGLLKRKPVLFRRESQEVDFRDLAQNAASIDILAWTCNSFFDAHDGFLQRKVEAGCKVRILLVSDKGSAASVIMDNSREKDLLEDIRRMKTKAASFCKRVAETNGSFEIREVNWVTPFGMVIIDSARTHGLISIGLHPLYLPMPRDERRFLIVDSRTSMDDFTYFRDQFEQLWNSGGNVCSSRAIAEKGKELLNTGATADV